jgi:hypothetical protein
VKGEKMRYNITIKFLMVLLVLLFTILMTGIGYAAEMGELSKINENPIYMQQQKEFELFFVDKTLYEGKGKASVELTGKTSARMNITELNNVGDYATVIFTIENKSNKISADLNVTVSNTNTEYFNVTTMLSDTRVNPKMDKVLLKVTVELIKLPIGKEEKSDISISISANPKYDN